MIAVDMLTDYLGMGFPTESNAYFASTNAAMNSHVFEKQIGHFEVDTSVLCIESDVATVFNIGDAPVFYFEKGNMRKLSGKAPETVEIEKNTFDDKGVLQTEIIVKENIPYMCYGAEECEAVPYVSESIKLNKRAYFLLCSRSVCDMVDEGVISAILSDKKIKSKDKAARIVDAAIEKNPDGNYTAEVISVERGLSITDADVRSLMLWLAVAMGCALMYFAAPRVIAAVSNFLNNSKEFIEARIDQEEERPKDGLKWIPKKKEPDKKTEHKTEEKKEQEETIEQQDQASNPAKPSAQQSRPSASQTQTPAASQQKPSQAQQPAPEIVVPLPESSALPETNNEVELPIDFN